MCVSRFYQVRSCEGPKWVEVEDVHRVRSQASLLAFDDGELRPGDWVSVLSGYVIDRVDAVDAASVTEEIRRAETSWATGGAS